MAQYSKSRNPVRAMAHTRNSIEYTNGRLPPVHTGKGEANIAEGMIVSSMAVPPQKQHVPSGSLRKSSATVSEIKPKSGGLSDSLNKKPSEDWERILKEKDKIIRDKEKELKDRNLIIKSKENDLSSLTAETGSLQERIAKLEKECKRLEQTISEKEKGIEKLQSIIDSKKNETDYKTLYETEKSNHEETTKKLSTSNARLKEMEKELLEAEKKRAEDMEKLRKRMEEKLATSLREKDEQLKERDERIQKMKKQMAEAFTGNSVERQQQIDELTKELSKLQGECDGLRHKLRHGGQKNLSPSTCENCKHLKAHLEKKEQVIKERNRTVDELTLVCGRYETQLKQQEELLKQWQDVKGRVLIFEK